MAHHIDGERARDTGNAGNLARVRAVERGHDRIEVRLVRIRGSDRGFDLVVHAVHNVGREQPFDDRRAVTLKRAVNRVRVTRGVKAFDCGNHVVSSGR
jgi:hypothetical protein